MTGFVDGLRQGFIRFRNYLREGYAELKRVRWPSRKELISYTIVVCVTCVVMSALIFVFDIGIAYGLNLIGVSH